MCIPIWERVFTNERVKKVKRLLSFLLLFLLPAVAFADLEVRFLDVGHGDSAIILCDGEAMIIDGGDKQNSDKVFSALTALGITELKYAVATHPQEDHVGGLASIFHAAAVRALYTPVTEYTNDRFEMLMDKATINAVPVTVPSPGDTLALGGATVTILAPVQKYEDPNDMSIVLRVDYGANSFIFCADAGTAVEKALMSAGANLDADVIKIAHHGSKSASSEAFLSAVSPRYAVISCSSRYDNPDDEVRAAVSAVNATMLRTDVNGDIVIASDGENLTVTTEVYFVGNAKSDVYHRMTCSSVAKMKEANKVTLYTPEQAEKQNYKPCKNCNP